MPPPLTQQRILEVMNVLKSHLVKHLIFWIVVWLLQSLLFSGGSDFQFYLVKNIAIVSLQALVVYVNLFLAETFLSTKKYGWYSLIAASAIYLVFSVSFSLIDLVSGLFFPSIFKVDTGDQAWWPTGFWRILSGSAPYSIALLCSTIYYLVRTTPKGLQLGQPQSQVSAGADDGIILIKEGKTLHRINTADVLYVEGLKEYVNWHIDERRLITLHSLQKLEELLGSKGFLRTHKSFIVNTNCVDTVKATSVEISGRTIPIGRSYREKVQQHFNFK